MGTVLTAGHKKKNGIDQWQKPVISVCLETDWRAKSEIKKEGVATVEGKKKKESDTGEAAPGKDLLARADKRKRGNNKRRSFLHAGKEHRGGPPGGGGGGSPCLHSGKRGYWKYQVRAKKEMRSSTSPLFSLAIHGHPEARSSK